MFKRILALLLIPVVLGLTGCWNLIEPENYAWLAWLGLDRVAGGKIQVTVALTPPLSPVPTGASPPEKLLIVSSAVGDTLFDALRELNSHLPKRLFYSYMHAVIIGEGLAREGVEQDLDLLFRNVRLRKNAWVFITRGPTDSIFKIDPQIEKDPAKLIDSLVTSEQRFLGKSRVIRVNDFQSELASPGFDPVVSVLGIWDPEEKNVLPPGSKVMKNTELAIDGSALFRGDKLVGWLSPEESQTYLLSKGEMKTGLIVIPHPDNPVNRAGIEVIGNSAKLIAKISDDQAKAKITIKIDGKLGDQWLNEPGRQAEDPNEDPEFYRQLGEGLEKKIKSDVEDLLNRSQTEFDADIFGIGDYIMNRYPNDWEQIQSNWREYYKKAAIEVEVTVNISSPNILRSHPTNENDTAQSETGE
ncbi:exported hypothetical protein [Candidatus Desulfosporosinus infrequens]|uniref:Germination, Ger(X)C family protein n=1 Tax=Candidatus Desulfosporosinus infrequens TaxID=2043169 RepID=A0A2U3KMF7_9FIRM|nr:exported hypothetical protein [Candidatus Desulfosporosinus infrequens]